MLLFDDIDVFQERCLFLLCCVVWFVDVSPFPRAFLLRFHFSFQGCTPLKFNIDTKNGHVKKESPFPNHPLGYPF